LHAQASVPDAFRARRQKHALQTFVCACEHAGVDSQRSGAISITLSPTQVEAVVRAASANGLTGIASLLASRVALAQSVPVPPAASAALLDCEDPRLSRSLLRGVAVLSCFGAERRQRGVVELAAELHMSASTAHRYAHTLVQLGLLERCPSTRKYRLPGGYP